MGVADRSATLVRVDHGGSRAAAAWALALYCFLLAVILLNPSAAGPSSSVAWVEDLGRALHLPEVLLSGSRVEFMMNAAMFVPVSLLGSIVWKTTTWRDWTAYAFLGSGLVEAVQGVLLSGRSATFVDVVANTLGALIGGLLIWVLRRWRSLTGS